MRNNSQQQRLFWSVGAPFRYLGFTMDELLIVMVGFIGCVVLLNMGFFILGLSVLIGALVVLGSLRNFKKMSKHFLLKSYLLSKGFLSSPDPHYPHLLGERVYR